MELNKVMIVGRLTRDPEAKYLPSGMAIASMSLAVNRRAGKDKPDETMFLDVTAWDKTAEFCKNYLKKGAAILVEGHLREERWQDKEGNKRSKITVVAERIQFAESRRDEGQAESTPSERSTHPMAPSPPLTNPKPTDEDPLPF